jgi:hypothetical protein
VIKEGLVLEESRYNKEWRERYYVLTEWHLIKYETFSDRKAQNDRALRAYSLHYFKSPELVGEEINLRYKMLNISFRIKCTDNIETAKWFELFDKYSARARSVKLCNYERNNDGFICKAHFHEISPVVHNSPNYEKDD